MSAGSGEIGKGLAVLQVNIYNYTLHRYSVLLLDDDVFFLAVGTKLQVLYILRYVSVRNQTTTQIIHYF